MRAQPRLPPPVLLVARAPGLAGLARAVGLGHDDLVGAEVTGPIGLAAAVALGLLGSRLLDLRRPRAGDRPLRALDLVGRQVAHELLELRGRQLTGLVRQPAPPARLLLGRDVDGRAAD